MILVGQITCNLKPLVKNTAWKGLQQYPLSWLEPRLSPGGQAVNLLLKLPLMLLHLWKQWGKQTWTPSTRWVPGIPPSVFSVPLSFPLPQTLEEKPHTGPRFSHLPKSGRSGQSHLCSKGVDKAKTKARFITCLHFHGTTISRNFWKAVFSCINEFGIWWAPCLPLQLCLLSLSLSLPISFLSSLFSFFLFLLYMHISLKVRKKGKLYQPLKVPSFFFYYSVSLKLP